MRDIEHQLVGSDQPSITGEPLDVSKINQLKQSLEDKLQYLRGLDERILALTVEKSIESQADEIKE